jgi:predicted dinucleotide-binding enzyme
MPKHILIQLDCDPQPSTFDAVVAVDAGVDVLLRHGGVTPESVVPLVHGAMFTRGGDDLRATAIFVGGADVAAAEAVAERVRQTFFGPVRVGVLVDPNGANTTASAAVIAAARHVGIGPDCRAVVLGGTGPVGQRVARLLAGKAAEVTLASRSQAKAAAAARRIEAVVPQARVTAVGLDESLTQALATAQVIVAAGAAGVTLLDETERRRAAAARVIIDLNAVPPAGVAGIVATDKARPDGATLLYGALGVGGTKLKIHKAAITKIFTDNTAFLDAEDLLALGERLEQPAASHAGR